jgi:2-alkenal reductase
MADRSIRVVLLGILLSLAIISAQLHLNHSLFAAADPSFLEPRTRLVDIEQLIVELFEKASPSVVQVSTISGADEPSNSSIKIGSGFVWDTSGNVVTNEHVVHGATTIWIWFASGESVEAEVVGMAPNYDLAVIRFKQAHTVPAPILIGASNDLKVGQFAYAIGSPFGLDQSLTMGVISALNRKLPTNKGHEISNIIQTDAAIHPGNSGGPLLNSAGRLIGVNTIAYAVTGSNAALGFAIPVDLVNRIVPELINVGRVPTAGIGIVPGDDKAAIGPRVDGVVIARIKAGSPAERVGLQGINSSNGTIGDIITEADGKPVRSVFDLTNQLERSGIGNRIALTLKRNDQFIRVEVEIVDIGDSP